MTTHQQAEIQVCRVTGRELERYIPELARLRIQVFREYPYLYQGDTDYEANYLRTYSQSQGSVVVLALDAERVVGASTALPLIEETEEVISPFVGGGYAPGEVFYLGESVLLPNYRGRGIGVRFFQEREAHARALAMDSTNAFGPFLWFSFCAVERDSDDPRRPRDYVSLDDFWHHRGYRRQPQLRTEFSWRELDEAAESPKPMVFWLKPA